MEIPDDDSNDVQKLTGLTAPRRKLVQNTSSLPVGGVFSKKSPSSKSTGGSSLVDKCSPSALSDSDCTECKKPNKLSKNTINPAKPQNKYHYFFILIAYGHSTSIQVWTFLKMIPVMSI